MTLATTTTAAGFEAPHPLVKSAFHALGMAVPSRAPAPVLRMVRVARDGDDAVLSAYDFDTAVTVRLPGAANGSDAPTLVPHGEVTRVIAAAVKGEPKKVVDALPVAVTGDGAVTVGDFTVPTQRPSPDDDAPDLPPLGSHVATAATETFLREARRMLVTTSRDEQHQELTMIQCLVSDGSLTMYSTDRYRAATTTVGVTGGGTATVYLPVAGLREALPHLTGDEVAIHAAPGKTVSLISGPVTVTMSTVGPDREFPRLSKIIDVDRPCTASVDVESLAAATKKVAALSKALHPDDRAMRRVVVEPVDGALMVKPWTQDPARTKGTLVAVTATSADPEDPSTVLPTLAFQPEFMLDVIATMPRRGIVTMHASPEWYKPVEFSGGNDSTYRHVVQPTRADKN